MPAEYEERILFHFPAGSARSQTSDIPQRYIKAIPREGEFAFDREPSPAGSARSQTSMTCGDTAYHPLKESTILSLRAIPRRRSRPKPSTHRSPGQKSAKNLDFSRMG